MKYKHSKQAEQRALEINAELETLNTHVSNTEIEARKEDIDVETREELINDIQSKVEKRNQLESELSEVTRMQDELKQAEERQFGLLSNVSATKIETRKELRKEMDNMENGNVLETRAYELAFAKYVKTGNDTEMRALTNTVTDSNAGVLVPTTLANRIADKAKIGGRLVALCSMTSIRGLTEYPIVNSKSDPEVHAEATTTAGATSKKEKDITMSSVSIDPQFIAEILRTTDKFEADTIEAFWDWLAAELPDALMRVIDKLIMNGLANGTQGVRGILTNTDANFVATLPTHELDFNTHNQAVALLDDGTEDGVLTIAMNRKTFLNNVMGIRDTSQRPIFEVMTNNLEKPLYVMGGYPVVFTNTLPAYDTATAGQAYMVVGDFSAMRLNFPLGMSPQITRDAVTEADKNVVRYISKTYVGGNITSLGSFVKVTK